MAWRRSTSLLQAREEEEEDRGEKRREKKRDLDWSLSRSRSLFFCCNSLVFSNKKFCL